MNRAEVSLSARRAWIEILPQQRVEQSRGVALRKESVDRNVINKSNIRHRSEVALRKESVDRNVKSMFVRCSLIVALRKESVDRNVP